MSKRLTITSSDLKIAVAGMVQIPPVAYEKIWNWANSWIKKEILLKEIFFTSNRIDSLNDRMNKKKNADSVKKMSVILSDLKKELGELKSEYQRIKVNNEFKINMAENLSGWKYENIINQKNKELIQKANNEIGVITIKAINADDGPRGLWEREEARILLFLNLKSDSLINDAKDALSHEIVHWCQSYIKIATGYNFGFPPKKYSNPDISQDQEDEDEYKIHSMDDIEFQPLMVSIYSLIKKRLENAKKEDRKEVLFSSLGIGEKRDQYGEIYFISSLKKHAPLKWKRFVNEVIKSLPKEIFD